MKTRSVTPILVLIVLVLTLAAATAPAAWGAPGARGDSGAPAWDLGSVLSWFQGLFGGWLGGGVEKEGGVQNVTGKVRSELDPNGVTVTSQDPSSELSEASVPGGA